MLLVLLSTAAAAAATLKLLLGGQGGVDGQHQQARRAPGPCIAPIAAVAAAAGYLGGQRRTTLCDQPLAGLDLLLACQEDENVTRPLLTVHLQQQRQQRQQTWQLCAC